MSASRNIRRWLCGLVVGLFALGLVIIAPALLFGIALAFGGERTVFERSASPDGGREARVQFDDAGAVSGFDRIVFVKSRWNPSDEPLLSCRAFWADGEAAVHLRWLNAQTLEIRHAFRPENIQAEAARCGGVRIVIRSAPPLGARRG
jgi:hypothetical protein